MAIYYVAATGNDANDGLTTSTPWATITRVNTYTFTGGADGDSVLFKRGDTFFGQLITITGTNRLTFGAYGTGAKPVITGFVNVASWTNKGGGIYESNALTTITSAAVNVVSINGTNYGMGRYPAYNSTNKGYLTISGIASNQITGTNTGTDWSGAEIVIRTTNYALERGKVTSTSGGTINFTKTAALGNSAWVNAPQVGYGYFFQNDLRTLAQFGDWYYNTGTQKLSVYFGSAGPSGYTVQVAGIDEVLKSNGNNVTFNNLNITGGNVYGFTSRSARNNVHLSNCDIAFCDLGASVFRNTNSGMDGCTFSDCQSFGLLWNGFANIAVTNTTFQRIGQIPGAGWGYEAGNAFLLSSGDTALINCCRFLNIGYCPIEGGFWDNVIVQNSYFDTFCNVLQDGGAIHTGSTDGISYHQVNRKNIIRNNLIINGIAASEGTQLATTSSLAANGIYTDGYSNNFEIYGNVVANIAQFGFFAISNQGINLHDNVFYNCGFAAMGMQYGYTGVLYQVACTAMVIKNNVAFMAASTQKGFYILGDQTHTAASAGTVDKNYYCRPSDESGNVFQIVSETVSSGTVNYTLSAWQSHTAFDAAAKQTPGIFINGNTVQFLYNNTSSPTTATSDGVYVDPTNSLIYNIGDTITLAAYTGMVLLKVGGFPAQGKRYHS